MPITVAIVGSGPAGYYTADALLKSGGDIEIDVIDRLPTPFGLIRGGVAPDHQTTKNVARAFEKTALNEHVRYFGNVEIARDLSLGELREMYDAVVLAIGASAERELDIPGADKKGIYGSAAFVGWYNGHPDFRDLDPEIGVKGVAVIGQGNVAVDIARVLVKTPGEMASSDLVDYAAAAIHPAPIADVYMIGRRGPVEAKFTNVELRELGNLDICAAVVDPAQLPDAVDDDMSARDKRLKEKNLETLKSFAAQPADDKPKRLHIMFHAKPVEVLGGDRVEGLRLERTRVEAGRAIGTGEFFDIECGLIVPAIGYLSLPLEGAPFDNDHAVIPNDNGRVEKGLYAVGWIMRGPTGVISSNRPDGTAAAAHIVADFPEGEKPGRAALTPLLRARGVRVVNYAGWKKIEAAEIANAPGPAPRRKFATIPEMLAILDE